MSFLKYLLVLPLLAGTVGTFGTAQAAPLCTGVFKDFEVPISPANLSDLVARSSRQETWQTFQESLMKTADGKSLLAHSTIGVLSGGTVADVLNSIRAFLEKQARTPLETAALNAALKSTAAYLDHEDVQFSTELAKAPKAAAATSVMALPSEVTGVDLAELRWPGHELYANSRLGPVKSLLKRMGAGDEIVFSNEPFDPAQAQGQTFALQIPISSYSKDLHLEFLPNGHLRLHMNDLPGSYFLRNWALLVRDYFERQGHPEPKLSLRESAGAYEKTYHRLAHDYQEALSAIGHADVAIFGYSGTFRSEWASFYVTSFKAPDAAWGFNLYVLPNGTRAVVLTSSLAIHGEILGESFKRWMAIEPKLKKVYFAGSGGSLDARKPYLLTTPRLVVTSSGASLPNQLAGPNDHGSHTSVLSPMVETAKLLNGLHDAGVTTIDMEVAGLGDAVRAAHRQLGFGIVVTDFPRETAQTAEVSLVGTRPNSKRDATKNFARAVLSSLSH